MINLNKSTHAQFHLKNTPTKRNQAFKLGYKPRELREEGGGDHQIYKGWSMESKETCWMHHLKAILVGLLEEGIVLQGLLEEGNPRWRQCLLGWWMERCQSLLQK